ncbi:DNA replication/repair protein RecF [Carboxylicivirga sediminis]|uniref:DNA replication and repair protein RecF n=1 Tax=Carboxylicivirga sediminis TaxID=2006564 RepID=A0A941F187_9BACT|nr:DNA replication/repair protein RecF [Carboxylicivirga sediminis]MBR8534557.1 DNA replication/repair protein RecF [Carboxylicivirga sediminis]
MHIRHLNLINFKNIEQAEIAFSPGINCLVGDNGSGKTNVLDALYYLSFCKSYFNAVDSQNINHQQEFFVVQGQYLRHDEEEHIYCGLKKSQKKHFKRNKKEYSKLSEHIGLLPLVMISPSDEQLINEGSEQRRKYIDGVISQYDKPFLDDLMRYNRSLMQRNATLKQLKDSRSGDYSMLDLWDEQLEQLANRIYIRRVDFIKELVPVFQKYYAYISDGKEEIALTYKSHLHEGDLKGQLAAVRSKDIVLGYTTKGVHKDDLELLLGGYSIKKIASQGQKKTFLIALKLAQYEFIHKHNGIKPILLLDDIFDKLDDARSNRLLQLVAEDVFNQIFITDTNKPYLVDIVKRTGKAYKVFDVANGQIAASS